MLVLAAEALVGAIAAAGRRTGRVGERGRGLLSGEVFVASFFTPLDFEASPETLGLLSGVDFVAVDASEARGGLGCVGDFWLALVTFLVAPFDTLGF